MPASSASRMAEIESRSSWAPQANSQPDPPIAHAPKPIGVMIRSEFPSRFVFMIALSFVTNGGSFWVRCRVATVVVSITLTQGLCQTEAQRRQIRRHASRYDSDRHQAARFERSLGFDCSPMRSICISLEQGSGESHRSHNVALRRRALIVGRFLADWITFLPSLPAHICSRKGRFSLSGALDSNLVDSAR